MANYNKNFIYTNFSGGINLNASKVGLLGSEKKLFWDDSTNIEVYKNFGVASAKGNVKILETQLQEAIIGISEVESNSFDFVFVTESGKICYFSDDLGTFEELLVLNKRPACFSAVKFLDGVLILTGTNRIQYLKIDGTKAISEVIIEGSDGDEIFGETIAQFASRVWVSSGSTLYFSSLGTYNVWNDPENAGYISNFHTSESKIVAMTEYAGKLAIYKTDGVYLLSGFSTDDFSISKIGNIGAISIGAVVSANNKQFFLNKFGVYALEQFGELGQIGVNCSISENVVSEFSKLNLEKLDLVRVLHYKTKNQIWFFLPCKGFKGISNVLIYDLTNYSWTKRLIPYDICASASVCGKILTSTFDGKIFVEDFGNTFAGKPIEFSFLTPFFHFGNPNCKKTVEFAHLILDENYQNAFKFSVLKDFTKNIEYDSEYCQTISPKTLVFAQNDDEQTKYNACWSDEENGEFTWAEPIEDGLRVEVFDNNSSYQLKIASSAPGDAFGLIGIEFKDVIFD